MAGDWIKMRRGLRHDPKVIAMSRELGGRRDFMNWWSDPVQKTCHDYVTEIVTFANVTRVTVCALLDVWASLNNTIKADGHAPFMCLQDIDDIAEIPGFGEAMRSVGWVQELEDTSLVFPNFTEHNTTAKDRETPPKTGAQRAKEYRDRKRENEAVTSSRNVTLEKRREEKIVINSTTPEGRQEFPTLAQVKSYAQSAPVPIAENCAVAFHDTNEAAGWITKHGHPIMDWRAALRRYASHWNQNEQAKRHNTKPSHQPTPHKGIQETITVKIL